jgi:hypothetical protein
MGQLFTSEQSQVGEHGEQTEHALLTEQDLGRNPTLIQCKIHTGANSYRLKILYHSPRGTYHEFVSFNRFRATPYRVPAGVTWEPMDPEMVREFTYDYDVQYVVPRNVLEAEAGQSAFFTHYNGDRPYLVFLSKAPSSITHEVRGSVVVSVYCVPRGPHDKLPESFNALPVSEQSAYYTHLAYRVNADYVWVGASPLNRMTEYSGGHGPTFLGNSLLLHIGGARYVFVGHHIYQFESYAPIATFTSSVGNSNVPYPYAQDRDRRFYFLLDDGVLQHVPAEHAQNDPYAYYYAQQKILEPSRGVTYGSMVQFFVGSVMYNMTHDLDPRKEYARLTSAAFSDGVAQKLYVENGQGEKREVTEADYVALMRRVGRERGFLPLKQYRILVERVW